MRLFKKIESFNFKNQNNTNLIKLFGSLEQLTLIPLSNT
jgi:hypothetical protein